MNGAESLVGAAIAGGVDVCFANPGTTELPLVQALDSVPGIRSVLGLFEGVCTGAADGFGRMAGRPALTLLHLGPGLANGLANLHNARRARTPVVNVVGDQATWHRHYDAPLTSDILSLAWPVSGWVRTTSAAAELAGDLRDAVTAAATGCVATLIVPADCQWDRVDEQPAVGAAAGTPTPTAAPTGVPTGAPTVPPTVAEAVVERVAEALRRRPPAALLLGAGALSAHGLTAAARVAAATGCRLLCETFPARLERGGALPVLERLPYFPDRASATLAGLAGLVLAGAAAPVSFFGYPGEPSSLVPEGTATLTLARPGDDVVDALERLADAVTSGARTDPPGDRVPAARASRPELTGPLTPKTVGALLAALQPEGAIVVDEAATSGLPYFSLAAGAAPHTYLSLTGGAIGQGLPCATGAALACPDRPVVAFQADGSGMYTLQALWTQAREGLDVTTLICANRGYKILRAELARGGVAEPGPAARALTDLTGPTLDWVQLAAGMGVPARRVTSLEQLGEAITAALTESGPHVVEVVL